MTAPSSSELSLIYVVESEAAIAQQQIVAGPSLCEMPEVYQPLSPLSENSTPSTTHTTRVAHDEVPGTPRGGTAREGPAPIERQRRNGARNQETGQEWHHSRSTSLNNWRRGTKVSPAPAQSMRGAPRQKPR